MKTQIIFIQGGGDDGYAADRILVDSLQASLCPTYHIHYPVMPSDESLPDFGWVVKIEEEIVAVKGDIFLVAHSLGASMLLKYLSEKTVPNRINGIFLIATPHWEGNEDWKKGLMLDDDFGSKIPDEIPIFLYHCRDDEEVPFSHLDYYVKNLPEAKVRKLESGGHQFGNDLSIVGEDIRVAFLKAAITEAENSVLIANLNPKDHLEQLKAKRRKDGLKNRRS